MMLTGIMAMGVRIHAGRCGSSPGSSAIVAALTLVVCMVTYVLLDGPLYSDVKVRSNE